MSLSNTVDLPRFEVLMETALRDQWMWGESCGVDGVRRNEQGDSHNETCRSLADTAKDAVYAEYAALEARKDAAYLERNRCVALIARMAISMGLYAGVAKTAIPGWTEDWHGCVYIDLPTGQVSWHFHDSQAFLFEGLPAYAGTWDGHDTPAKYDRVAAAFT